MQCRTCGYALWNLTEPRCPECGTKFDLREYRFKPGAVAFGCPYCGALHEGAGEAYLPSSGESATCRGCGQSMAVAQMRVVLLSDDPDAATVNLLPWQRRKDLGWWKAWLGTCKMGMTGPVQLGRWIRPEMSWGEAYAFAALTHGLTLAAQAAVLMVLWLVLMVVLVIGAADADVLAAAGFFGGMVVALLWFAALFAGLAGPLLLTVFVAGPAHLLLYFTGEKRAGFNATAVTTLYAQGPMLLQAIPVCGYYFSGIWQIWTLVVSILMLKDVQKVSGMRASLAYLWLPAIVFALYVAAIVVMAILGEL